MYVMEQYQMAWERFLTNCLDHGIERRIDFQEFMSRITIEQVEKLSEC